MFVYMSKKIAIPKQSIVTCISWNRSSGYIAVGGEDGMLKVLKLESGGGGNLSMNLSLEGHSGQLRMAIWNEVYQKLTTSDEHGVIIVWMLYKGSWYEEMINNRNKSTVTGMAWGSDGQKICIAYEDGAVIVGSVDGSRVWGKDIKGPGLAGVQWSPDNTLLLFALTSGELHVYDDQGNFMMPVSASGVSGDVVRVDWFAGRAATSRPALLVCFRHGAVQLMNNCVDNDVILVETGMAAVDCGWNHDGSVFAVAGCGADNANVVQFFSFNGEHIRTLKVPGGSLRSLSWEAASLRLAIAIDSYIYFASVKPDHKYAFYGNTLAVCSAPETVTFTDITTNQSWINTVPEVADMAGCGEYCALATRDSLIISNQQGIQCDAITVSMVICFVAINSKAIVAAASKDAFLIWKFSTPTRPRGTENLFHMDGSPASPKDNNTFNDTISCIAVSDTHLLVGRELGTILLFSMINMKKITSINMNTKPYKMGLNSNSSKLYVIDQSGGLYILDTDMANNVSVGQALRRDVWAALWASDNPQLLAAAEKARLYVLRGTQPEEPLAMVGYFCQFKDLEITLALLDRAGEKQGSNAGANTGANAGANAGAGVTRVEVKSLRDTRQLLQQVGLREAETFIKDNPHPTLWLLLAEAALKQCSNESTLKQNESAQKQRSGDTAQKQGSGESALETAEAAFVRRGDYAGVRFVARLAQLHSAALRKAEILVYFKDFDAAEKIYLSEDRRDLAIALRRRLGHWARVVALLGAAPGCDAALRHAYCCLGDCHIDTQNWTSAIECYKLCNNVEGLKKCYMALEDNESLAKLLTGSPRSTKEGPKSAVIDESIENVEQTPSMQAIIQMKETGRMLQAAFIAEQGGEGRQASRCFRRAAAAHWLALAAARAAAEPFRADAALRAAARLASAASDLHENQQIQVWTTIAYIAIEARAFKFCSKAFIKLEALDTENVFENLAIEVFTRNKPKDQKGNNVDCPNCQALMADWWSACLSCSAQFPGCSVSARPLPGAARACPACRARAAPQELVLRRACPMCHAPLT